MKRKKIENNRLLKRTKLLFNFRRNYKMQNKPFVTITDHLTLIKPTSSRNHNKQINSQAKTILKKDSNNFKNSFNKSSKSMNKN